MGVELLPEKEDVLKAPRRSVHHVSLWRYRKSPGPYAQCTNSTERQLHLSMKP